MGIEVSYGGELLWCNCGLTVQANEDARVRLPMKGFRLIAYGLLGFTCTFLSNVSSLGIVFDSRGPGGR